MEALGGVALYFSNRNWQETFNLRLLVLISERKAVTVPGRGGWNADCGICMKFEQNRPKVMRLKSAKFETPTFEVSPVA